MVAWSVCSLVFPVVHATNMDGWQPGPMRWDWPVTQGRNDEQRAVTDRRLRLSLVRPHAGDIVYGRRDERRWHRSLTGVDVLGWTADAVELLEVPEHGDEPTWLFVVHLVAPPDADVATDLAHFADLAPERTTNTRAAVTRVVDDTLPGAALRELATDRQAYVVSHTTFGKGVDAPAAPPPDVAVPSHLQWSRLLASGNTPSAMSGELLEVSPQWFDLALSSSWCATVLRRGTAFVGTTPEGADMFHATARALVRSVYLDAVLLALVQREVVRNLTARVPALLEPGTRLQDRLDLQRSLIHYRAGVWSQTVAESQHMNDVLATVQRQFDLPATQTELATDIADLAQISQQEANRRITLLLNVLIAVSAGAAVAALVFDPGSQALIAGLLFSALIGAFLVGWGRYAERAR